MKRKKEKNNLANTIIKILIVSIVIFILIFLPLEIEKMIFSKKHIPFYNETNFAKDVWFGFIASYLGTIGTVLLGIIALYQNKRYKELSDESEKRFIDLQTEIKELNKKNVELIEINTKIEKAKYYPILSEMEHYYWNMSGKKLEEDFNLENSFQITIKKESDFDKRDERIAKIFDDYYTFVYVLKNEGERTIRNFSCYDVKINNKQELGFWIYYPCDIEPGEMVYVVYATKINIIKQIQNGEIYSMDFMYNMENVLGERYTMSAWAQFYDTGEEIVSTVLNINGICKNNNDRAEKQ